MARGMSGTIFLEPRRAAVPPRDPYDDEDEEDEEDGAFCKRDLLSHLSPLLLVPVRKMRKSRLTKPRRRKT